MRVLVTGAAGFVGSHVARQLSLAGHFVLGADSYEMVTSVELKEERVRRLLHSVNVQVVEMDLAKQEMVTDLFERFSPEVVIHLAARPGVRNSANAAPSYIRSNLVAFANVWHSAHTHGVDLLLYASSSSVYGRAGERGTVLSEDHTPPEPMNLYGATKLANEAMAQTRISSSRLRTLGLRFFTLYGPWGRPDMLPLLAMQALKTQQQLSIFGDGSAVRDFTFIGDAVSIVEALIPWAMKQPCGSNDVVNIADGTTATVLEFLQVVQDVAHCRLPLKWEPALPNEMNGTKGSDKRLAGFIGERDWTPLREGVERTWEWFSNTDLRIIY